MLSYILLHLSELEICYCLYTKCELEMCSFKKYTPNNESANN